MADMATVHWRDSGRQVRFFGFDARIVFAFCFWGFHMCWESFVLSLLWAAFFVAIELFGMRPMAALRSVRTLVFGGRRPLALRLTERGRLLW
ncbi:MAG: IcmT/TraK family protein [Desulfovibrionaceae bacterium]|nr:IcmT/TraK family protein [Desulfovibrionaceae bacterium]